MKKSLIMLGALAGLALVGGATAGLLASNVNVVETKAEYSEITFYYAISSDTVGSQTVKSNIHRTDDTWVQSEMTNTGKEHFGKDIYSVTVPCTSSISTLQFQLYNGDKWASEVAAINNTNTSVSTISGKIYNGSSWVGYLADSDIKTATVYLDWFNWSNVYIYTFESINGTNYEMYGAFPGQQLSPTDANLIFNSGKLQSATVKYYDINEVHFVYSIGSDENKSDNLNVTDGAYYWHNGTAWTLDSGDRADAAAFVNDLNVARLAVARDDENDVKAYSICGLNASTWVNRYNSNDLSNTARGYIDATTIWTYKDADSDGADTTIKFSAIINELNGRVSSANVVTHATSQSNVIAATSVASIGLVSLGGFFFIRKKRLL